MFYEIELLIFNFGCYVAILIKHSIFKIKHHQDIHGESFENQYEKLRPLYLQRAPHSHKTHILR